MVVAKMPHAFAALKVLGAGAAYPKWIFIASLHYEYLRQVDHPVYQALMHDHMMCNEHSGEVSFSELSRGSEGDPNKYSLKRLQHTYRMVGVSGALRRQVATNRESTKVGASKKHRDLAVKDVDIIEVLKTYLRNLCATLHNGEFEAFIEGEEGVTATYIPKGAETATCDGAVVYIQNNTDFSMNIETAFAKAIKGNTMHNIDILLQNEEEV